jgi:Icc-related predicted phosphoesterase
MTIIDCIADLHGHHPKLDGGDLLIVAGDLTSGDTVHQHMKFLSWICNQHYKKKIWIAGNHDNFLIGTKFISIEELGLEYLCNSGTEFEGLKIWGTPHSLIFDEVNPKCTAFMGTEEELKEKYDLIPEGIDILISHTPPNRILDENRYGEYCGSVSLRETMFRIEPKYLICGHLHECGGKEVDLKMTSVINCSYVNEWYEPNNEPMRITI